MSAVTGVDHGNFGSLRSDQWGTLFWMTHSTDICKTGNNANGIRNAFTFGCGTGIGGRKTKSLSTKIHHGSFETETGTGTWFIEQSCNFFTVTGVRVFFRVLFNVICQIQQMLKLLNGEDPEDSSDVSSYTSLYVIKLYRVPSFFTLPNII